MESRKTKTEGGFLREIKRKEKGRRKGGRNWGTEHGEHKQERNRREKKKRQELEEVFEVKKIKGAGRVRREDYSREKEEKQRRAGTGRKMQELGDKSRERDLTEKFHVK